MIWKCAYGPHFHIIRNSNVRGLGNKSKYCSLESETFCYSGSTSKYIASHVHHIAKAASAPVSHVLIHSEDIDVRSDISIKELINSCHNLIDEIKGAYRDTRPFLNTLPTDSSSARHRVRTRKLNESIILRCSVNPHLTALCYENLALNGRIHLSGWSKSQVAIKANHACNWLFWLWGCPDTKCL